MTKPHSHVCIYWLPKSRILALGIGSPNEDKCAKHTQHLRWMDQECTFLIPWDTKNTKHLFLKSIIMTVSCQKVYKRILDSLMFSVHRRIPEHQQWCKYEGVQTAEKLRQVTPESGGIKKMVEHTNSWSSS